MRADQLSGVKIGLCKVITYIYCVKEIDSQKTIVRRDIPKAEDSDLCRYTYVGSND
jgi:hypothetical protein